MSLLQAWLSRIFNKTNLTPTIATAISDDGSGDPIAVGKPSPLRADPTTGALLVSSSGGGGGGGEVTQGTGDATVPWYMQGTNSGTPERLATATLQGAGLPGALTAGGGVKTGLVDAIPTGTNTIGKVDQGAGSGTAAGFYTVRLSDGSAFVSVATAAKQPSLGIAGTPSADVLSMQGISGGTPLPVSGTVSVTGVAAPTAFTTSYSVPTTIPVNALGGVYTGSVWTPMRGDASSGLITQGGSANASAVSGNPFTVAVADTNGNTRRLAGDTSGRARVAGEDEQGNPKAILTNYRGAMVSASANLGGDLMVTSRVAVCRGISSEGQNFNLFAKCEAGSGTVAYNATTGRYDITTTVTSLDSAIHIHNSIVHYVENNPMGFAITAALSSTTTTNKRIEFAMMSATATTGTNFLTADRFGFYVENGILGVFAYSTIAGAYLFQVAQSAWTDPLNGTGTSKRTFTYATALLNQFKLEANQVWLGSDDMEFVVNDVVVYTRDFKFSNPTANPISRVPHMRPYVAHHNTGVAAASTVSVNCLEGVRYTQQLPIGRQFTSSRNASRTALATATEVPVYALRVNSATKARQFLLERFTARATTQNIRVRCYIGRSTDFAITGGTWETPANNRGTLLEENKATGTEMAWTPTAANLNKIVDDVVLSVADVTKEYDTETYFEEGFPLKGDAWLGIDGDGEHRLIVWTATAEAGANGQLNVMSVHGREIG